MAGKQMERESFLDRIEAFETSLRQLCAESYKAGKNIKLSSGEIADIIKRGEEKIIEYDNAVKQLSAGQLDEFEVYEDDVNALKGFLATLKANLNKLEAKKGK